MKPTTTQDGAAKSAPTIGSLCFVAVAFRYGGNENVFPIGVFATREAATAAARDHRGYRGGKYDHRVYEFRFGVWDDDIGRAGNRGACIEWEAGRRPETRRELRDRRRETALEALKAVQECNQRLQKRIEDLEAREQLRSLLPKRKT